jgi:hypothetical protein
MHFELGLKMPRYIVVSGNILGKEFTDVGFIP